MTHHKKTGLRQWLKGFMFKHMHRMITCKEFEDFVLDYLDNELPDRQRSQFELHIRLCRECRQYLQAYKHSMNVSHAVLAPTNTDIPNDVPEDLIKAILKARKK